MLEIASTEKIIFLDSTLEALLGGESSEYSAMYARIDWVMRVDQSIAVSVSYGQGYNNSRTVNYENPNAVKALKDIFGVRKAEELVGKRAALIIHGATPYGLCSIVDSK